MICVICANKSNMIFLGCSCCGDLHCKQVIRNMIRTILGEK